MVVPALVPVPAQSVSSMRDMTRLAPRTGTPEVVRRRSQASQDVPVSMALSESARTFAGRSANSAAKVALRS